MIISETHVPILPDHAIQYKVSITEAPSQPPGVLFLFFFFIWFMQNCLKEKARLDFGWK